MIILHSHLQPQFKNELFHTLHIVAKQVALTFGDRPKTTQDRKRAQERLKRLKLTPSAMTK